MLLLNQMGSKLAERSVKWVQNLPCAQENRFRKRVAGGQYTLEKMIGSGSEFGVVRMWRAGP